MINFRKFALDIIRSLASVSMLPVLALPTAMNVLARPVKIPPPPPPPPSLDALWAALHAILPLIF